MKVLKSIESKKKEENKENKHIKIHVTNYYQSTNFSNNSQLVNNIISVFHPSIISQFHKDIILIPTFNALPISFIEPGPSIQHIILKLALNPLITSQKNFALAVFQVIHKLALVIGPVILQKVPVVERELFF